MGLGPTLVGGVIGAAVGMGLHLIVETTTSYEAPWFAIVIGLLTGLGVHQANKSLAGRVSYLRGAVSAGIALAAIVGSTPLISLVARNKDGARNAAAPANVARSADDATDAVGTSAAGADAADAGATAGDRLQRGVMVAADANQLPRPGDFNVWQFVFMAAGTFIAYEFGRGTGTTVPAVAAEPHEPVITDPSN